MALDFNSSRLILWLRANGIALGEVLTVGRLGMFTLPELLEADARRFGIASAGASWREVAREKYCEPALLAMGAASVRALDYSSYEGAALLHDLNQPLPPQLENCCDLLFDGGSLEHVFDVPEALNSYVKLVRPGGWIILDMPADGRCGHGFYQFSPELFYQFFDARVGCRVAAMFCVRDQPDSLWYLVPSPAKAKQRVEPADSEPLHLLVVIRRETALPGGDPGPPHQADYLESWKEAAAGTVETASSAKTNKISPMKWLGMVGRKLLPVAYWRFSVIRNDRRRYRACTLDKGELLPRVDPFTWRLDPAETAPKRN